MYVWSARLVATSNEALLLTLLIQKLATTMEKLRWKNLVGKEKLCRNFDGTDAQHPFDQTPLRRQLLLNYVVGAFCVSPDPPWVCSFFHPCRELPHPQFPILFALLFFFLGNFTFFFWKLRFFFGNFAFFFWKLRFFFGKLDLPFFWNF